MKESTLQTAFTRVLEDRGLIYICARYGKKSQLPIGWPDYSILINGGILFIETKAPGGKARPEQLACHAKLAAAGYRVLVLDNIETCVSALGAPAAPIVRVSPGDVVLTGASVSVFFEGGYHLLRPIKPGDERNFRRIL